MAAANLNPTRRPAVPPPPQRLPTPIAERHLPRQQLEMLRLRPPPPAEAVIPSAPSAFPSMAATTASLNRICAKSAEMKIKKCLGGKVELDRILTTIEGTLVTKKALSHPESVTNPRFLNASLKKRCEFNDEAYSQYSTWMLGRAYICETHMNIFDVVEESPEYQSMMKYSADRRAAHNERLGITEVAADSQRCTRSRLKVHCSCGWQGLTTGTVDAKEANSLLLSEKMTYGRIIDIYSVEDGRKGSKLIMSCEGYIDMVAKLKVSGNTKVDENGIIIPKARRDRAFVLAHCPARANTLWAETRKLPSKLVVRDTCRQYANHEGTTRPNLKLVDESKTWMTVSRSALSSREKRSTAAQPE